MTKVNQKGKKTAQTILHKTHAMKEQGKNRCKMLQEDDEECKCNDRDKNSQKYQMSITNEDFNKIRSKTVEQLDINNVTIEVLD